MAVVSLPWPPGQSSTRSVLPRNGSSGRKGNAVAAAVAGWGAEAWGDVRAAGKQRLGVVDDALAAQHKRHVVGSVVEFVPAGPGVERRLRHPDPIDREVAGRDILAEPHQAFAGGGVIGKPRRGRMRAVGRLHIKGDQRAGGLPRDRRGEHAIARHARRRRCHRRAWAAAVACGGRIDAIVKRC